MGQEFLDEALDPSAQAWGPQGRIEFRITGQVQLINHLLDERARAKRLHLCANPRQWVRRISALHCPLQLRNGETVTLNRNTGRRRIRLGQRRCVDVAADTADQHQRDDEPDIAPGDAHQLAWLQDARSGFDQRRAGRLDRHIHQKSTSFGSNRSRKSGSPNDCGGCSCLSVSIVVAGAKSGSCSADLTARSRTWYMRERSP